MGLTDSTKKENNVVKGLNDFALTIFYPILIALLTLLFWVWGNYVVGFFVFSCIGTFFFITRRDISPVFPLVLAIMFMPSGLYTFEHPLFYLVFLPAGVGLVIHFIKYPIEKFKVGELALPLAFVFISFCLGGIGSADIAYYHLGLVQIFGIGFAMLVAYLIITQYLCPDDNFNFKEFFFQTLIVICLIPCIEVFLAVTLKINCPYPMSTSPSLGWGNKNFVGYIILFAIPLCCYFIATKKQIVPYFLVLGVFVGCLFLLESDGATGIVAIMSPLLFYFTYKRSKIKNKKAFLHFTLTVVFIVVVVLFIYALNNKDFFKSFVKHFLNDNARTWIYSIAWKTFLKYPVFGNGAYAPFILSEIQNFSNYHSTIFHPLATMGIVGFIAYAFLLYKRLKVSTKNCSSFNLFGTLAIVLYELYTFIDSGEFIMIIFFVNLMALVLEYENSKPTPTKFCTLKPLD